MNTVCLVGRPNTGKSTIFNRIVKKKISIIEDTPGVTRDRIYSKASYNSKEFILIDTGGIETTESEFSEVIKMQVDIAIDESDVVVFVVDGKEGLTPSDSAIRDQLKKSGKKVIVAINKIDSKKTDDNIYEFYALGFDDYVQVSGEHGYGIDELLNKVTENFFNEESEEEELLKFSVIGRPNTGKSSLVNALLNEKRVIVSNVSGTTRDAIDTHLKYEKQEYILIDTAGLRKKGRIYESVEKYSLLRSMKAIDRSDVCILVLDADTGIVEHDKHVASYALDAGKALVIVVNKWDLAKETKEEFTQKIRNNFQFLPYAKIVFLSALTKKGVSQLMPQVLKAYDSYTKEVKTNIINSIVRDAYLETPPATYNGKKLKIYFCHQSGIKPPRFDIEVNSKKLVHFSYERYLENSIRKNLDFTGTPIHLYFKNKGEEQ